MYISLNILLNFRFRSPYLNNRPLSIYLDNQPDPMNLNFGHGLACLNLKLKQLRLNLRHVGLWPWPTCLDRWPASIVCPPRPSAQAGLSLPILIVDPNLLICWLDLSRTSTWAILSQMSTWACLGFRNG